MAWERARQKRVKYVRSALKRASHGPAEAGLYVLRHTVRLKPDPTYCTKVRNGCRSLRRPGRAEKAQNSNRLAVGAVSGTRVALRAGARWRRCARLRQ